MCFGRSDGYLVIGTVDRRFQSGETVWAYQRVNELGYTYDVLDVRVNNETFYEREVGVGVLCVPWLSRLDAVHHAVHHAVDDGRDCVDGFVHSFAQTCVGSIHEAYEGTFCFSSRYE